MTIQPTSLAAYHDPAAKPRFSHDASLVLSVIQQRPRGVTDREIAFVLGWWPARVSARRAELRPEEGKPPKPGDVVPGEKRSCAITGKWVLTWKVYQPEEQLRLGL